jgi:hypothetical protein
VNTRCPHCGDPSVRERTVVEHVRCGCVGLVDSFEDGDGRACPECRTDGLGPDEVERVAALHECSSCGSKFDRLVYDRNGVRSSRAASADTPRDLVSEARADAVERTPTLVKTVRALPRRLFSDRSDGVGGRGGQESGK